MSDDACPRCQLPKDELAWQCDGCGYLFGRDLDSVRADVDAKLRRARRSFVVAIVVGAGIAAGLVALAIYGFYYIDVPFALALVGGIGFAWQRMSVLQEHARELDRRRRRQRSDHFLLS